MGGFVLGGQSGIIPLRQARYDQAEQPQATNMTPKQSAFVTEYLLDSNGTQAAIRAGYSTKTANEQATQLLKKPEIQDAIRQGQQAAAQRNVITVDSLLAELEAARQVALSTGKASAMVSATMGKARLLGFDKGETTMTTVIEQPRVEINPMELKRIIEQLHDEY